ncbi:gliding motility-associated protein GldE [Croceimicrobium sp.]|uniref:gliding motility-associated protein GldE n=1 Tax=Croceimicrobium sp. TaxID=2828340 RepID=UPI003BA87B8B
MDPEPSSLLFLSDILQPFTLDLLFPLVLLLILLLGSALVSGSEVAFFSITPRDIDEIKERKHPRLDTLTELLDHPKTLLATILIANNFINVGIVILSKFLSDALFDFSANEQLGLIFQIGVITFLILLFGEVLPKVYATKNSTGFGLIMCGPMFVLRRLFRPVSILLVRSTGFFEKRLQTRSEALSVDDLSQALEITSNEESPQEEQKILEGIVKFGSTNVKQIMKPRMDVVSLDQNSTYPQVMEVILSSGFSRIPIYEESFDQVRGILYIKDLLSHIEAGDDFQWQSLLREPFFVPENKKIDDLLREFQDRKIHLAIVVDEYGGTSGIVTLEDIIEEIVGEISDEFDEEELFYSKLDDRNYVFEAKIHLTDFFKVIGAVESDFEDFLDEAETLAGLLLEVAGKFPEKNEEIDYKHYRFKVESLDGRRMKRIKVSLMEKQGDEEA